MMSVLLIDELKICLIEKKKEKKVDIYNYVVWLC